MKKLVIVGAVLIAVVLAFGAAGYVFAQSPTPPTTPWGGGMMGGRGGMMGGRGGMMGGAYGPMHTYMVAAMADALDMTVEDLNGELADGKTMWQVAEAKGLSADEFATLMQTSRQEAVEQMVADGALTQEQADWMLSRMETMPMWGGNGTGGCPGMGGGPGRGGFGGGGAGRGGRWNNPPAEAVPSTSG